MIKTLIFIVAAYLLGSVSFAIVSSKLFGLADPRTYGSKNPGATNVLRTGNKKAALFTLIGDAAKGWVAVFLAMKFGPQLGVCDSTIACVAVAVFLGHLFPVFAKFEGGKGVATALGVLLALNGWIGLLALVTWLLVAALTRYSSLSALTAAVLAPAYTAFFMGFSWYFAAVCVISALLIYRHRSNISNLLAGKESKIGAKKTT